jgi:hypothetical protein
MSKGWASLFLLSFGTVLSLAVPIQARADFVIKFTDGGQVIVHRYVEEGQTIKVYTPQGTISFRKDDVARITEVDVSQSMSTPLESVSAASPSSTDVEDSNKTTKPEEAKTARASDTSSAAIERIDSQYQEIEQEFNKLWEKDVQDVNSGASEEVLTENRNKLNELSNERRKLVNDARQVAPDNLPTWAQ